MSVGKAHQPMSSPSPQGKTAPRQCSGRRGAWGCMSASCAKPHTRATWASASHASPPMACMRSLIESLDQAAGGNVQHRCSLCLLRAHAHQRSRLCQPKAGQRGQVLATLNPGALAFTQLRPIEPPPPKLPLRAAVDERVQGLGGLFHLPGPKGQRRYAIPYPQDAGHVCRSGISWMQTDAYRSHAPCSRRARIPSMGHQPAHR